MTTPVIQTATEDYECNASLFIKDCLDDLMPDLTFAEKRTIVKARANNWHVQKGESVRFYVWDEGESEEMECWEIPEMAAICTEHDLWP